MDQHKLFEDEFNKLVSEAASFDLESDEATTAMKNLKTFSEVRPPAPEPEPTPDFVPVTKWEKFKHGLSTVWDNETTRTLIKAGGAFGGVALVTYTTIRKDHVLERQALGQANQSPVK